MEEVFEPFLERESSRLASEIKNINDMMVLGKRGTKRTMDPTASKTNLTPRYKKIIAVETELETDSENEMELDEGSSETDQV